MSFYVIAEVGSNWYAGDPDKSRHEALLCCEQAIGAGADIVKFQLFRADTLYSRTRAPKLHEKMKNFELPLEWIPELAETIHKAGKKFWLSIFDASLIPDIIDHIDGLKIASGDATNVPLIKAVSQACEDQDKPVAISLGAATVEESWGAIFTASDFALGGLIVFHCVSAYPAFPLDYNLNAMLEFREDVNAIGLSDHTLGVNLASLALALGYTYFEKHFKPNLGWSEAARLKELPIRSGDWDFSMSPCDLQMYVGELHGTEQILGDSVKAVQPCEESERLWARRGSDGVRPVDEVREE